MNLREYIINNFKEDNKEDIRTAIETSISSNDEEPLIGLGVIFELCWNNSDKKMQNKMLDNIKLGLK